MNHLSATDCLGALTHFLESLSAEMRAILQHVSLTEQITSTYEAVNRYLPNLPMVVDWMKRSAFRRVATMVIAMALSHYPEGFEVDLVSEGYCSNSGTISVERAQELISICRRCLGSWRFASHLASQVAPGKPAPEPRNFPAAYPFRAMLDGALTTHVVNEWKVVEEPLATTEASTSAGKQAVND
jgi:hypothetical protein